MTCLRRSFVPEANAPVKFDALPQDRHFAFAADGLVFAVAYDVDAAPGGSGLMMTRCSTARIAARLRLVLQDSQASRTRSDGGCRS